MRKLLMGLLVTILMLTVLLSGFLIGQSSPLPARVYTLGREQFPVQVKLYEDGSYVLFSETVWSEGGLVNVGSGCIPHGICNLDYKPIYPE